MQNVGYNRVVPAAWHEFLKCYMSNVVRLLISIHHTVFLNAPVVHYYYLLICVPLAFIYARHRSLLSDPCAAHFFSCYVTPRLNPGHGDKNRLINK